MKFIAFDCETALFRDGLQAPPLACGAFVGDGEDKVLDAVGTCQTLHRLLDDQEIIFVGHNIAYDWAVTAANDATLLPKIFAAHRADRIRDTKLREQLIDIALTGLRLGKKGEPGPYSLSEIAKRRLGIEMDKTTYRLGYGPLISKPLSSWPPGALQYCLDDVKTTLSIYHLQTAEADDYCDQVTGLMTDEARQCRANWAFQLMGAWGIRTDRTAIDRLEQQVEQDLSALRERLIKAGILTPSKDGYKKSTKKLRELVQAAYGPKVKFSDKGNIVADSEALRDSGDELLIAAADYQQLGVMRTTFVPLLRRGQAVPLNVRVNTLINSGRTSESPNLQNQPRSGGVRECFRPRDGFVLCSVDYDTAELRAIAQFCFEAYGFSAMRDAIVSGRDVHTMFAATLLDLPYDEVIRRKREPEVKKYRDLGKVYNFGVPGGMKATRLQASAKRQFKIILTLVECEKMLETYFRTWPEMRNFLDDAAHSAPWDKRTQVTTPWSGRVRAVYGPNQYGNQRFQGPIGDISKDAAFDIAEECYVVPTSPLYGSRPVLFVHDEFVLEIPKHKASAAAKRQAELMTLAGARTIKDIPMTCTPALMERWTKAAEAIYEDGELVVWKEAG